MILRLALAPVTIAALAITAGTAGAEAAPAATAATGAGAAATATATVARPAVTAAAPRLTVMSYNVNYGTRGRGATMDAIAAGDADVVLLQETTASWEKQLRKRFADQYAHMVFHHHARAAGGLAVLSRHPIADDELLSPAAGWFPAQRLTLDTPLGALDVLHVHLRPAIVDGSWLKGYLETPPIRLREIAAYWRKLPRAPRIVAGDFNEEPGKGVEQFLAGHGMARIPTSGTPTSWRWSGTYRGRPVALALDLDHVIVDGSLTATTAKVLDAGASDHRPVLVTLTQ